MKHQENANNNTQTYLNEQQMQTNINLFFNVCKQILKTIMRNIKQQQTECGRTCQLYQNTLTFYPQRSTVNSEPIRQTNSGTDFVRYITTNTYTTNK